MPAATLRGLYFLSALAAWGVIVLVGAPQARAQSLAERAAPKEAALANLPPGFAERVVATGLTGATGMAIAPDGRVFVCEQTGALRVAENDVLLKTPFVSLEVDDFWERGLIGVTLDPEFERNGFVYVCYVSPKPFPHHVISRFTAQGNVAAPGSEKVLLEGDDQRRLGGSVPAGHQGGGIRFGNDGKLYVGIGEQTAGQPAQRLDTFQGKLLRIDPDGSIPEDNPFYDQAQGKYRAIWARGLRNPFAFAVQPSTGRLFINDVGGSRWEEINEGRAGANYGWPVTEGPSVNPAHQNPVFAYGENPQSISGGTFYEPFAAQFPREYENQYFFADYIQNWLRVIDPARPSEARSFATGLAGPVAVEVAPDGSLYYLNRNVWVKDEKFQRETSSLHKVVYLPNASEKGPRIVQEPHDITCLAGEPATFRTRAEGNAPLRYQWRRDGRPVTGSEAPELSFPVTSADHGAQFVCIVSSDRWSVASKPARLWVAPQLKPVETTAPLASGLNYRLYQGDWIGIPDFALLQPLPTDSAFGVGVPPRAPAEGFGLAFDGFLTVPQRGVYTFFVRASGACRLWVGGREVAFVSPFAATREASGVVGLEAGRHELRVLAVHREGAPQLAVEVEGPGLMRRALPSSWLSRINPRVLTPPTIAPAGQRFSGPVWIELSATAPGTTIQYTLDGSNPDGGAPEYREPFLLQTSATVIARSFRLGGDGVPHASAVSRAAILLEGDRPFGLDRRRVPASLNLTHRLEDLPPRLSQTGVFRSLDDLTAHPGLMPYTVNVPLWSDGADKRRWIALPGDAAIGFREAGSWTFPAGTVFVKHFELAQWGKPAHRLETRLLYVDREGGGYGATYKWNSDQTDADLLTDGLTETLDVPTADGRRSVVWQYPSPKDCLACHTRNAGFVLGVNTRQLNCDFAFPQTSVVDNQLRAWRHVGMFENPPEESAISRLPRLAAIDEDGSPLAHRVRSYLDANCAHCHRPGGVRGAFDARYEVPLERQGLIRGKPVAADVGVPEAQIVAPGSVERSLLYLRMSRRQDVFNMPPLASHEADLAALAVFAEWITGLPAK